MAYTEKKVTIKELFESGKTRELSIKALRSRAEEGVLVFVETKGNINYYDESISIIRVLAARKCKRPGIRWKDISKAYTNSDFEKEKIVHLFNQGKTEADIIQQMTNHLNAILL